MPNREGSTPSQPIASHEHPDLAVLLLNRQRPYLPRLHPTRVQPQLHGEAEGLTRPAVDVHDHRVRPIDDGIGGDHIRVPKAPQLLGRRAATPLTLVALTTTTRTLDSGTSAGGAGAVVVVDVEVEDKSAWWSWSSSRSWWTSTMPSSQAGRRVVEVVDVPVGSREETTSLGTSCG